VLPLPPPGLTEAIPPLPSEDRVGRPRAVMAWNHAKSRLKADMPMGRGIPVGQVEGNREGGYLANTNHGGLPGTGFIPEAGKSKLNGHATAVATHIAGPQSAGQGIRAVHAWPVAEWLDAGYLNMSSTEAPRSDHPARVFNHSWISPTSQAAPLILRRIDYHVDQRDVLIVAGVNNSKGDIPALLASAYNVISVGAMSRNHSDGLTTVEGEGRSKPELVAPGNATSWSTGIVTGVCAALLEYADRLAEADDKHQDAAKSETIKAVLLAGAYRPEDWTTQDAEPLDRTLGAGVVDIDRSLVILNAGHAEPDTPTNQRYAWSFAQIDAGTQRIYTFNIDKPQGETGIALVWHRRVIGGKVNLVNRDTGESREIWNPGQFTPNLNLGLVRHHDDGSESLVASSTSQVDNVELIHLPKLDAGKYTLRIARANDGTEQTWDYALAWRIEAPTD
jgi:hypothetical protein